jgi:hypothetical protein
VLEHISGSFSARCPVKRKPNFSINAGATEYLPVAAFDERIDKTRPPPSEPGSILLHFPINPLSDGNSYLDAGSYELSLLATSAETGPDRARCRLSVEDGLLTLQRI